VTDAKRLKYRTLEEAHSEFTAFQKVRAKLREYEAHAQSHDLRHAASHVLWELECFLKLVQTQTE